MTLAVSAPQVLNRSMAPHENKDIFPQFDLFPRITKIGRAVLGFFQMHQLASHGRHFNHGAAPMLDEALDDPGEPYHYP